MLAERAYNTSKAASEVLVGSHLGDIALNYVAHKVCVCRASADRQKKHDSLEKSVLTRRKKLSDRAGLNRLQRST